jgi:hypothetical protein
LKQEFNMATIASHSANLPSPRSLSPQTALRYAWYVFLVLLACPFVLFLLVVWRVMDTPIADRNLWISDRWFLTAVAYMVLIVPASFFVRSRWFRPYWKGESVPPYDYLKGMFTVWGALELGGLFSLFGCLASGALLPSLLPALAAFVMFGLLWPNGRAMVAESRGASDDPERYEEPR